jgi:hypothetical protein
MRSVASGASRRPMRGPVSNRQDSVEAAKNYRPVIILHRTLDYPDNLPIGNHPLVVHVPSA